MQAVATRYNPPPMTTVELAEVSKQYGSGVPALDRVSLTIKPGELFFLLGPSGCGKSTLLRIVAGLTFPSSGKILFNGRDATFEPTESRNAVMCFQSYALWPHMTIEQNVGFGLQTRGWDRRRRRERVAEMLKLVQLDALANRRPNQLSGGQQQRVALARALAVGPDCLLLDEPLSNLDSQLRIEMRSEIRRICKAAGSTTIYVTHDQREALSVADRIAVLRAGRLEQVGTPQELYQKPANSFVAGFVGQTNLLSAKVSGGRGQTTVRTDGGLELTSAAPVASQSGRVVISIRPEHIRQRNGSAAPASPNQIKAQVTQSTFLGEASEHVLEAAGERLRCLLTPPLFDPPTELIVSVEPSDVVLLPE